MATAEPDVFKSFQGPIPKFSHSSLARVPPAAPP
jgi:hypothetical protein